MTQRWNLKIRHDTLAVSSVLFTLGLLIHVPATLGYVWTFPQTSLDIAGHMGMFNYYAQIGFASLAIIVIGLIVTWAGYIKGARWTWFVMFLITWVWAFPVLFLAEFHWRNMLPIAQWPPLDLSVGGPKREFAESVLTWLLMVLALMLPLKTFIRGKHAGSAGL
jgi:hypothetical protein